MLSKSCSIAKMMGCCSCFGFTRKHKPIVRPSGFNNRLSQELLLDRDIEDEDDCSYNGDGDGDGVGDLTATDHCDESEAQSRTKRSEEILHFRTQSGMICRQFPVKETHKVVRAEVKLYYLLQLCTLRL